MVVKPCLKEEEKRVKNNTVQATKLLCDYYANNMIS